MSGKAERQQARETVANYHAAQLTELLMHVVDAADRLRSGDADPFDVDHVVFQYSRAAKELWKFCNSGNVELIASQINDAPKIDWWERGAPRPRRQ